MGLLQEVQNEKQQPEADKKKPAKKNVTVTVSVDGEEAEEVIESKDGKRLLTEG